MTTIIVPGRLAGSIVGEESPLHRSRLRVQVSSSNTETLAFHQALRADLIVADLGDPLLTGEMLCERVRANETLRQVAILLLCADTEPARRRAGNCQANKVLTLPVDPGLLVENIVHLLSIAERKSYRVLVQVKTQVERHQETFYGITRNLSGTGLLLETERSLQANEHIHCVFYLPNGRQVHTEGEIARGTDLPNGAHQYGIKFVALDTATRQTIEEFVRLSLPAGL